MAFTFEIEKEAAFPVLCLQGNLLERNEAQELLEETNEVIANETNKIIIDLEELDYINSSGLNVILNIFTRVRNANGELVICHVNEKLKKLLVITKLHDVIKQTNSREEAATLLALEN
jgi:anti-sigma B factor antagonist